MAVSADAPGLDMAYKLVAFAGEPKLKLSEGKETLPGAKQGWRVLEHGTAAFDVLDLASEPPGGDPEPLLVPVMENGRLVWFEDLAAARERARRGRSALPPEVRTVDAGRYQVQIGAALSSLRAHLTAGARRPSRSVTG